MVSKYLVDGDKDEFNPDKWTSNGSSGLPKRSPQTSLDVLIAGGGLAGLMTALECWRKGHNVVGILERSRGPLYSGSFFLPISIDLSRQKQQQIADTNSWRPTGDIIIIGPSALCILRHWPDMCRELEADRTESVMYYRRHSGELILGPTSFGFNDPKYLAEREGLPLVAPHQIRKKFYQMLLRQVARVGLKVEYGQHIERYFEDEAAGIGGVVTQGGSIRVAHVVVAADANRTRSDLLIAGEHTPAQSSGMSVYRAALPTELAMQSEAFRKRWGDIVSKETSHEFWIGPGMHLGLMVSAEFVAWGLTPRDHIVQSDGAGPTESWDPDIDPEKVVKVLRLVPDWDPAIDGLIRATPKGSVIHWPLLWRNLRRDWTSKGGRVVQVGDAAHSTIPASASGGTLALEDAVTLATCLELACSGGGTSGGPLGTRTYNLLRYERVSCAQKMSFVNSEVLGTASMDDMKKDPERVRVRFPRWLFQHDPEAYVYEKYGQAFAHIVSNAEFKNTNLPPGHKFKPWTIEQIHEDARNGKSVVDFLDGDWS